MAASHALSRVVARAGLACPGMLASHCLQPFFTCRSTGLTLDLNLSPFLLAADLGRGKEEGVGAVEGWQGRGGAGKGRCRCCRWRCSAADGAHCRAHRLRPSSHICAPLALLPLAVWCSACLAGHRRPQLKLGALHSFSSVSKSCAAVHMPQLPGRRAPGMPCAWSGAGESHAEAHSSGWV